MQKDNIWRMSRFPDFIIIGAMKSATSTLRDQLNRLPGIYMSDPKEPNFFSDDENYRKGINWYAELFSQAPAKSLLGEASTHYTKLPTYPRTLSRLRQHLPKVRFIYLMRHPIDRLISHYVHECSMGVYRCNIETAIEQYDELVAYGRYAYQLEPYFDVFGQDAVLPVFFDRLKLNAQVELERIGQFIGYPERPLWSNDLRPSNVSSERIRRFPLYRYLIESDIATRLRRRFVSRRLRDRVKNRLTMQHRPTLEGNALAELEGLFDKDLALIGACLGVDLNCENFKRVTAENSLNWVPINE